MCPGSKSSKTKGNALAEGNQRLDTVGFQGRRDGHRSHPVGRWRRISAAGSGKEFSSCFSNGSPGSVSWSYSSCPATRPPSRRSLRWPGIAGNGFRTIGVIAALEEDLGKPVLTGNQVALWYALRMAGVRAQVDDYGQVFSTKPRSK